jgi:hypothetical protein
MSAIAGLMGSIKRVHDDVADMNGAVTALAAKIHEPRGFEDPGQLGEEVIRLQTLLIARMGRMQRDLSGFWEDSSVAYARLERVTGVDRVTTLRIADEINGIHRQIRTLQEEVRQLRGEH